MKRLIVVAVLAATLLSSCSSTQAANAPNAGSAATFPVTLTAANGKVTIHAQPKRIMSLSASATSMIYDIGAGQQVVAVDKYSTDPPNAPKTSLTGFETGAESYLPYHPDLVVLAQDPGGSLTTQLASLGIPLLLLTPATTINDTYAQITLLGQATGHQAQAAAENASIRQHLATIVTSVGSRARGKTYYQELDDTLYTATSKTFIGALYQSLGMVNMADAAGAAAGTDYPQLSAEALIQASPDYVFLADGTCCGQSAATFGARPGFNTIRAVQLHHVFNIPDSIASEWGPRVVNFLQMVADDVTGKTP